jgi:hypothetical protein
MRLSLFTLNLAALAAVLAPALLILQSVAMVRPIGGPDAAILTVLLAGASLLYLGATALLSRRRGADRPSVSGLLAASGLLFASAIGWLFTLARLAGLG